MVGYLKYRYSLLLSMVLLTLFIKGYAQNMNKIQVSQEKIDFYNETLNNNKMLVKFIENKLIENQLPKMMRNLSLIESNFNKNAVSHADAGGIWQFTVGTANDYGLTNNRRFDIYHSTNAAMNTLKDLYEKYNNWITVVAAYNCGEGNVDKAIRKANSSNYFSYYNYLPNETINHVRKFMEVCHVTNELDFLMMDYKFSNLSFNKNIKIEPKIDPTLTVTEINAAFDLVIIAEEMSITTEKLINWNPGLAKQLAASGTAQLYLPFDLMPDFLLLKNKMLQRSLKKPLSYD